MESTPVWLQVVIQWVVEWRKLQFKVITLQVVSRASSSDKKESGEQVKYHRVGSVKPGVL